MVVTEVVGAAAAEDVLFLPPGARPRGCLGAGRSPLYVTKIGNTGRRGCMSVGQDEVVSLDRIVAGGSRWCGWFDREDPLEVEPALVIA